MEAPTADGKTAKEFMPFGLNGNAISDQQTDTVYTYNIHIIHGGPVYLHTEETWCSVYNFSQPQSG